MATVTLKPQHKGQKKVTFKEGGLHASTHTPMGQPIPKQKIQKALAGDYGPLARKQALMYVNMLKKGQRTAAK